MNILSQAAQPPQGVLQLLR